MKTRAVKPECSELQQVCAVDLSADLGANKNDLKAQASRIARSKRVKWRKGTLQRQVYY